MPRWESVEVSMVLVTALGWSRTLFPNGGVPNLKQSLVIKTLLGQASKTSLAVMSLHRCNMSYWDRACVCKPSVIKCHRTIGAANGKKGRPTDQVTQKKENLAYVAACFWTWGILFCLCKILMALPFAHRTYTDRKEKQITVCSVSTKPVLPEGMKPWTCVENHLREMDRNHGRRHGKYLSVECEKLHLVVVYSSRIAAPANAMKSRKQALKNRDRPFIIESILLSWQLHFSGASSSSSNLCVCAVYMLMCCAADFWAHPAGAQWELFLFDVNLRLAKIQMGHPVLTWT